MLHALHPHPSTSASETSKHDDAMLQTAREHIQKYRSQDKLDQLSAQRDEEAAAERSRRM